MKESAPNKITSKMLKEINSKNEYIICQKVMMRYKIMKLRAKISYSALIKEMTIHELLISQIQKSYTELSHGKDDYLKQSEQEACVFQAIMDGEEGILAKLIEMKHFKRLEKDIVTKGLSHDERVVHVKVWKNGRQIESKIDLGKNVSKMKEVQNLFRKGQAADLFRDVVIDKKSELESEMMYKEYVKVKYNLNKNKVMLNKLNLMTNFKIV